MAQEKNNEVSDNSEGKPKRDFFRELAVGFKKEKSEPEEVESSPKEWKTKEVIDLLKKYDSHIDLDRQERADLAEKFDPGKKITKKKHVTDALRDLRSEYKKAPDGDKKRIAAEGKKSLSRFLQGK